MPPPRLVVATCAVVVVLLGACATGDDGTPSGTASPTPTVSPSPSVSVPDVPMPTPAPVAAEKSYEGAAAFVEYSIAVINRAYLTGDTKPLEEISTSECETCQNVVGAVDQVYAAGGAYRGGQMTIQDIETIVIAENVVPTVEAVVDISLLERLDSDGKTVTTIPAESATLLWDLSWSEAWSIAGVREPEA